MLLFFTSILLTAGVGEVPTQALDAIHLRDPFILPVPEEQRYYLYGTGFQDLPDGPGFVVYRSADLKTWEGPFAVFRRPEGFWATKHYWAPEVHRYQGKYFMFATFHSDDRLRGTQILVADSPMGPFRIHSPEPVTPPDWACLDGTFFLDAQQQPWIVFCHEWEQVRDGEICIRRLSADLTRGEGEPKLLFHASDAPWGNEMAFNARKGLITDGPFLHHAPGGALLILWSSFGKDRLYKQALARSASGNLEGPWTQVPTPIFEKDGGHGMLFQTFAGQWMLTLHQSNKNPNERPRLFRVEEKTDGLTLTPEPAN